MPSMFRTRLPPLMFLVLLAATSLDGQRRLPWTYDVPALTPGDRIRVWAWQHGPHTFPTPAGYGLAVDMHEIRIVGPLTAYDPPDSLRLHPTRNPFAPISLIAGERTVYWDRISRIDQPNGRDVLRGSVGGLGVAFGAALLYGLAERAFGCQEAHNCSSIWPRTARYALVAVPVGTVIGFFSTRWKRIY